jgi:hypothetical protein
MKNETHIVITSIFPPTRAVRKFGRLRDLRLTVVGDRKTPSDWSLPGVEFLSAERQKRLGFGLTRLLPWNHYCRKMLGYLHAMRDGASVVVDTDDDNIPYRQWRIPAFDGKHWATQKEAGFVNVYALFSRQHIWPRGFPLDEILRQREAPKRKGRIETSCVGVWQGLTDRDPDVDAIYRLTSNVPCTFAKRPPIVLAEGALCPFNSQNTAFRQEAHALLYLPITATFRFTDILRGLVAQPVLWAAGMRLGFTSATVYQERNPHDYMKDFVSEIPFYLHAKRVVEITRSVVRKTVSTADNLLRAYKALRQEDIVADAEIRSIDAWLRDLTRIAR